MAATSRILKIILLNMIPTLWDMGSDLLNSLDMMGLNVTSIIKHTGLNIVSSVTGNETFLGDLLVEDGNSTSAYQKDVIWGGFGIFLIFAPGIPIAIMFVIYSENYKPDLSWCKAVVLFTCYPLIILCMQLLGFCNAELVDKGILWAVGGEAFFESSPQMILQLFTIQYGYKTGPLQISTICLSFFLLAKTAIMFDLAYLEEIGRMFRTKFHWDLDCHRSRSIYENKGRKFDWKLKLKHVITVIPAYTTGIVFRIGGLSIATAYLRYFSVIPIVLLMIQYALAAIQLGYAKQDIPIAIIANLGSITRGCLMIRSGDGVNVTFPNVSYMFLKIGAILTFIHHCACLVSILIMTNVSPSYFSHWEDKLVFFGYTNQIICGVIGMGIVNLILIFGTGDRLNGPRMKNEINTHI